MVTWRLRCAHCDWLVPENQPVGVAAAHSETEHGTDFDAGLKLNLVPFCADDGAELLILMGGTEGICPRCHAHEQLTPPEDLI